MKDFIQGIIDADGEQWLGFAGISLIIGLAFLALVSVASDHKIRCYYLKTSSTASGLAYKIVGDVDWSEDVISFSTSDGDKALLVISELKQCAKIN